MSSKTLRDDAEKTESELKNISFKLALYFALLVLTILAVGYLLTNKPVRQTSSQLIETSHTKCLKTSQNDSCRIVLESADTDQKRIKGLSGRISMPLNHGMVFVYEAPTVQCYWMRDMHFALDFVWLNNDKEIVAITNNVSPQTYPNQFCQESVQYVIELNSGQADQLDLNVGQKLIF